ncbi:FlgD immunoglobulin-like domain containing protein [Roseivirga sp. BDSF3-8]|uniref:FlgD immunoglobulin-like domain containing protein n=1 Tax=Roseivirga sp. BDSF3-8 TaxID=3241598 RepID=UPI00353224B2
MRNGQRVLPGFILLTVLFTSLLLFIYGTQAPILLPSVPDASVLLQKETELAEVESREGRESYEAAMLRNPVTGLIPANIRSRELAYSRRLPQVDGQSLRTARTGAEDWRRVGPVNVGGRTRAAAMDVRNESIMLAGGVSGGMWRSSTGGDSWTKVTGQTEVQSVTSLAQDPRSGYEDTWYYGTGEIRGNTASGGQAPYRGNGIYKSTDNGQSWRPLPSTQSDTPESLDSPFDYVNRIVADPTAITPDGAVYAAVLGGIYRSLDGGASWQLALGGNLSNESSRFTDIAVTSEGHFYATFSKVAIVGQSNIAGIFFSQDGYVWREITPLNFPPAFERIVIGISPSNEDIVYFLAASTQDYLGRYNRATDRWSNRSQNLPAFGGRVGDFDTQDSFNMLLAVHPQDENIVFLGGTNLYRSRDGFNSTEQTAWIGGYATSNDAGIYPNHHPDQHEIVFFNSSPNRMLSAHDGGLSVTTNCLAEEVLWQELNNGYVTTQFYTVSQDEIEVNDRITGGLQDNGSYTTFDDDPSQPWARVLSGDGGFTAVTQNGAVYYFSFQNSQIYRVTLNQEGGITNFARIDPVNAGLAEGQEYLFINPFVLDPNNQNRMYLAAGDVVYRNSSLLQIPPGSQDPTPVNWERLRNTYIAQGQITAIKASREPANVVYYGTNTGKVYVITNAQSGNYSVRDVTSPFFPQDETGNSAGYVASIGINPVNASQSLVAFSNYGINSIFYSADGGANYQPVSGNLEENPDGSGSGPSVRWVEIIPLEGGGYLYLAGTSTGLYSTTELNGMQTVWEQEGPFEIGTNVVPMVSYRSTDGRIVVATHGNGVFATEIANALPFATREESPSVELEQNYPNPWRAGSEFPYTFIPVNIPQNGVGRVRIYDSQGRLIRTLLQGVLPEGKQTLVWDGKNGSGGDVAAGTYICRLEFEEEVLARRIVLLR